MKRRWDLAETPIVVTFDEGLFVGFFHLSWPPPKKLDIPNSQKYDSSKVDVQNIGTFYFCSFCASTDLLLLEFSARGSC